MPSWAFAIRLTTRENTVALSNKAGHLAVALRGLSRLLCRAFWTLYALVGFDSGTGFDPRFSDYEASGFSRNASFRFQRN